jgi:hypothetical protein
MPTPRHPFEARGATTVNDPDLPAAELNTNVAHPARVYDSVTVDLERVSFFAGVGRKP